MRTSIHLHLAFVLALVPACGMAALDALQNDLDALETEGGSTTADTTGQATADAISTVTSATISSGSESEAGTADATDTAGDTDGATTGDVDPPPAIIDHELEPSTLHFVGALTPKIWAEGADGIRMNLDGAEIELKRNEDTVAFEGQIVAYSALQNGDGYVATFTPWRDDGDLVIEGEALELPYTFALAHDPGDEDLWDLDKAGSGQTTAIAALPTGQVVELQMLLVNGSSGCFLRLRSPEGEVLGELAPLLPDHCKAIDLEVHGGAIYALLEAETLQGPQWFVARISHWGAPHTVIATGEWDEVAHALAISGEGTVAVCGSAPTPEPDDLSDAMARIVRFDLSQHTKAFDHDQDGVNHLFDERARGCAFDPSDDDRLIIVGEVYGKQKDEDKANRRFEVLYDVETNHGDLRVASAGLEAHSFAVDVAFAEGQTFILGSACGDDACSQVESKLWALDGDGDLASTRSLGLTSNEALGASRIRVSPAGYLVLTSGGLAESEEAFLVRAYDPFKAEPLFTFKRQDAGLVHRAHALAIGPYGQIYAGGYGANGYPLFVIIYG